MLSDSTCRLFFTGSENVLVFGGRTSACLALGDCYLLNVKSQTWTKVVSLSCILVSSKSGLSFLSVIARS